MKTPAKIFNRLLFRIIIPVVTLMLASGLGLYLFFNEVASDFTGRLIKTNLDEKAADLYSIVDRSLDELIKSGQADNPQSVRIKKALTLSMLEDTMRQNGLDGGVGEDGNTLLETDELFSALLAKLPAAAQENSVLTVKHNKQEYYLYIFEFEPWQWRIYMIKNSAEYAGLIDKVKRAYALTGLALLFFSAAFIFYLKKNINAPLNRITNQLRNGEKPDYQGIRDFELLSDNIGSILESLHMETEKLNSIYRIAISKRGKDFFDEMAVTTAGLFNLNTAISKISSDGQMAHVIAMFFNGRLSGGFDTQIDYSPCTDAVKSGQIVVIEDGVSGLYPHAHFLTANQVQSYACMPVCNRNGEVIGLTSVFGGQRTFSDSDKMLLQALSQMVAAEFELLEKTVFLDNILQSSTDTAIVSTGLDQVITYCNPAAEGILGYSGADVIGRNISAIHAEAGVDPDLFDRGLNHVKQKGEFQFSFQRERNGETLHLDARLYGMKDENGTLAGYVLMARDISDIKRLEEQLLHSQKLEAVGLLAGGVAHEFNNILMSIMGYAGLMKMKYKEDGPMKNYIEYILSSSEKAANLTQGLLAFSRKQIINPKTIDINQAVKEVQHLLLRAVREDIELKVILHSSELKVTADKGQIEQVLMNLATNARDAMPSGGVLIIETSAVTIHDDQTWNSGNLPPGNYALISVSDSGVGMDEKTREHIFEPFYTSKEVGKGTGLGLSVVFGIIKQHNGNITVYSEQGQGTTFKILLPQSSDEIVEEQPADHQVQPTRGKETILLVEDDPAVIKLVTDVLAEFGYTVIFSESENALDTYQANRERIDMLLLDVVMPKRSGKEVLDDIRAVKPDIRAMFMSGYTADIINRMGILDADIDFISKPISPAELLAKVREVLDS